MTTKRRIAKRAFPGYIIRNSGPIPMSQILARVGEDGAVELMFTPLQGNNLPGIVLSPEALVWLKDVCTASVADPTELLQWHAVGTTITEHEE